jgi:hypothetical protein
MKQELRLKFDNDESLKDVIEKTYFDDDNNGKIRGYDNYFLIEKESDIYEQLIGSDNITVKFESDNLVEGFIKCLVKDYNGTIKSYPISIYCIKTENDMYSFY